jgi:hypothetical protein
MLSLITLVLGAATGRLKADAFGSPWVQPLV